MYLTKPAYQCVFCSELFEREEIKEMREMGEKFLCNDEDFICPDCLDRFGRLSLEEQFDELMKKGDEADNQVKGGLEI